MDVIDALHSRQSTRAFLDKDVPQSTIRAILEAARWAPSGVNTQPWRVYVVSGTTKQNITEAILALRQQDIPPNPDYAYYPAVWQEPYKSLRKACGAALYGALHIEYGDKQTRLIQWNKNYSFFGAPVGLLFFIEDNLEKGSWVDMGMFIQSVMLAARHYDLATCPQAAMAEYPDVVRKHCKVGPHFKLICGMGLGYPDPQDPVNQYRTDRIAVDEFTTWLS